MVHITKITKPTKGRLATDLMRSIGGEVPEFKEEYVPLIGTIYLKNYLETLVWGIIPEILKTPLVFLKIYEAVL